MITSVVGRIFGRLVVVIGEGAACVSNEGHVIKQEFLFLKGSPFIWNPTYEESDSRLRVTGQQTKL